MILGYTFNSLQFKILYYFFKVRSYFKKIVENFEIKRIGGASKGYQFASVRTNPNLIVVVLKDEDLDHQHAPLSCGHS